MDYKVVTYSEEETIELAQNIESEKFPNMVICLRGDLGSGKTVFTKGFAKAMEITEEVTSPTFNIIKEYYKNENNLFGYDYFRFLVLIIFIKKINLTSSDYINSTTFIKVANSIKRYFDNFSDNQEEID